MDFDNSDIDLISQFRTMNTNDKDHLIAEFKRLTNTQLTSEGCCFYLDLAEWYNYTIIKLVFSSLKFAFRLGI